jgi:diphthamide synthase (EF-2-diphthine--ammonia ligase)
VYEARMAEVHDRARGQGMHGIAFGDLFLEDIRDYRLAQLAPTGLTPIFPCWNFPTAALAVQMIEAGLYAHLVCVDPRQLDRSFAGRRFDRQLLADLPDGVDPCGERGEFHTFVSDAPFFSRSIELSPGEIVWRDGFLYADLLPT